MKTITSDILFTILKKIIISLEDFEFRGVALVLDNNSVNRKCIKHFNNPLSDFIYPHLCDSNVYLFYYVSHVNLIMSVKNDWVNEKNGEQPMYYLK